MLSCQHPHVPHSCFKVPVCDLELHKIHTVSLITSSSLSGHGGARAAEYVKHNLFSNLIRHPKFISDTKLAIGMPFLAMVTQFYPNSDPETFQIVCLLI